jgi:hypothetical protein
MHYKKIEEIRLINKKKNDEICKQQEEDEKQRKDEEEARRIREEVEEEDETITPRNLQDVMNRLDYSPPEAIMEEADEEDERAPLKKQSGSSKSATRRTRVPQVSPPEPTTTAPSTRSSIRTQNSYRTSYCTQK